MIRRIIQASAPYFRNPYPYDSIEGRIYLRFVLYVTQKRNTVLGYLITRLAPLPDTETEDGKNQREELVRILDYVDPCIQLTDSSESSDITSMAKWYKETFGVPGTPEFEKNIERMNKELKSNDTAESR